LDRWFLTASRLQGLTLMQHFVNQMTFKNVETAEAWIGLKQNIIDTAVNDKRNHLCAAVPVVT